RDAPGQRSGMADLDGDAVVGRRGLNGIGRLLGFFLLTATVCGHERRANQHEAELLFELHGDPPDVVKGKRIIMSTLRTGVKRGRVGPTCRSTSGGRDRSPSPSAALCRAALAAARTTGLPLRAG